MSGNPPYFHLTIRFIRCDVGLEAGEYYQNCLCATILCTIIMVHNDTSSSYRLTGSGFNLAWFRSLSSERLCIFGLHWRYIVIIFAERGVLALDLVD